MKEEDSAESDGAVGSEGRGDRLSNVLSVFQRLRGFVLCLVMSAL
jgi:hypothetical protein